MIVLDYALATETGEPCIEQLELRAPGFAVTRARHIGCRFFDHSTGANPRSREWAMAVVVIEGTMSTTLDGAPIVLEPGDVLTSPTWASAPLYPIERNSVGIKASFRPRSARSGIDRSIVSRLSKAALSEVHDALVSAPTSDADARARGCTVAEALGAHDVPVFRDEVDRACDEVREVDRAFAKLVAAAVFPLARRTTLHDLARGLFRGERQVVRTSNEFFRRYFASVRSYREFAAGWRMAGAFALLSRGSSSVEEVAADVGFSSGAALCHAFKRVGVPSPAVIQARYAAP